jgi:hypothetical protein
MLDAKNPLPHCICVEGLSKNVFKNLLIQFKVLMAKSITLKKVLQMANCVYKINSNADMQRSTFNLEVQASSCFS